MNIHQIVPGIFYTGVNDRVKHRFEALWPIPHGVSYNSYLVLSEKTALIDGVELHEVYNLFDHLESTLQGRKLDYLVVNHMEPDHSGSIPLLAARYPEMKIVGNKQTIAMIGGFYHLTDPKRFHVVGDGDTLSLGDINLKFILTPMVHWPETMMTFAEERKVLFTGDAFGTFGALNGGIVDSEIDNPIYLEEAYRYYSNIVGKYGRFVQKAMEKVLPLKPEFVCPTHGPVWHDQLSKIAHIYDMLSKYDSEPGVTIVYGSMYGNLESVAERIAAELAARGEKRIQVLNAANVHLSYLLASAFRFDGLIVGGPTYTMSLFPPIDSFMKAMRMREAKNKTLGIFSSFTWASAAGKELEGHATAMNMPISASIEMKQSMNSTTEIAIKEFANQFMAALEQHRNSK